MPNTVAFSHHKIKISFEETAGQAVAYLADEQATGYYSESQRALMIWDASARAKDALGLGDLVELWKVTKLMNGQHPLTNQLLRQYGGDRTMVGAIDYTVSPAPKSVSVLWAMASPELRIELEDMVGTAVRAAVHHVTEFEPIVRERVASGPKGVVARKANDVVGLQVLHTTARTTKSKSGIPDPQLHVHHLLFAELREDGQLRAIADREFLRYQSQIDAEAQGILAQQLEARGFEIERELVGGPKGKGQRVKWELKGIPASLVEAMSARSSEVSDLMAEYRAFTGKEARGPGWDRFVEGRRGAKSSQANEDLRAAWEAEGRQHGFTSAEAAQLVAQAEARRAVYSPRTAESPEAEQFRRDLLAGICRDEALVPMRKLDAVTQQLAIGLVDSVTARRIVAQLFGEGDLLATKDGMVTTLEVLAQEQRAERALGQLLDAEPGQRANPEQLAREFDISEEEGRPFDPEQREAIALALSGARFVSISGPAGTGKGAASRAMASLWHDQGRRVFALAVAGRTAQQAAADSGADLGITIDGVQARTEHGALQLVRSDVLLIDEAAMIDHQRYADVLELAAQSQATVVQIGDDQQLSAVGPGGLWTVFHGLAAERGLAGQLRTVHRARNPAEAQAWTDLREGRIEEALTWYRDQGQLRLYETRAELLHGMVTDWWEHNPSGVMVVDTSNRERDAINRIAQGKRLEAGEIGGETLVLASGREIRAGDRVIFNAIHHVNRELNSYTPRVENGTVGTVVSLQSVELEYQGAMLPSERGIKANALIEQHGYSLLDSEKASLSPRAPNVAVVQLHEARGDRTLAVDTEAPLELAYARHINKGQGMTAITGGLAVSEQTTRQSLYVMASRFQENARIHAVRAEVEGLGVNVASLEAQARAMQAETAPAPVHEATEAEAPQAAATPIEAQPSPEIPEGVTTWAELQEQLTKGREQLDAREKVTIREIANRAARSQPKQAIARSEMQSTRDLEASRTEAAQAHDTVLPTAKSAVESVQAQDRARLNAMREQALQGRETVPDTRPDAIRQATRERIQERLQAAHEAAQAQARNPIPASLPARTAKETMARHAAETRQTSREALAVYHSMGRAEFAASPELRAVEVALAGRHELIVAQDARQEARILGLLNTAQQAQPAQHEGDRKGQEIPTEIRVAQASQLYQERSQTREAWRESTPSEHWHHAEPSAAERGVVVVADYRDQHALTRGTSTVKEAHVVTNQPQPVDALLIDAHAREIGQRETQQAQQQTEAHNTEAQQQLQQQAVEHSAGRGAEHSAEHSAQHQIEHAGVER